ncbi:MAG: hypothetical protein JWN43_4031 [Gammaproteobacteria bacterium]|nr:hypothetical protein [Gammaproteobacteria bacterium]
MISRKMALVLVTMAALAPAISNASPEKASVRACANAFATSIALPGGTAPAYKLAYRGSFGGSLTDFYSAEYTFTLEAHDPKTGLAIARARCSTDSHGTVTAISAVPLGATKLASRN